MYHDFIMRLRLRDMTLSNDIANIVKRSKEIRNSEERKKKTLIIGVSDQNCN